jgi:hypothetical protein
MSEDKDKTVLQFRQVEVLRGLSVQRKNSWEKLEIKVTVEGPFPNIEEVRKAEQLTAEHLKRELENILNVQTIKPFNLTGIEWKQTSGEKGPFELCTSENEEIVNLRNALILNNRSMNIDGLSYWLMKDDKAIGRRRTQQ